MGDIASRIAVLERFEAWGRVTPVDFEALVGPQRWASYWQRLDIIKALMVDAQAESVAIRARITDQISKADEH